MGPISQSQRGPEDGSAQLTRLDRYELQVRMGAGAQGETFRALDRLTSETVALKRLHVAHAESWKAIELFQREASVLRSLSHPGIPAFVDHFTVEGERGAQLYLVQALVEGESLAALLDQRPYEPAFDETQSCQFLEEMLEILAYLHGLNPPVVHRDIKPANIIRHRDGSLALVDFGTVQAVLPLTATGSTFVGTTGYVAPEQLMGRAVPASDLFSLGATAVHLLSGVHPGDLPVVRLRMNYRSVLDLSAGLARVVDGLICPTLDGRWRRAAEALEAVTKLQPRERSMVPVARPHGGPTRKWYSMARVAQRPDQLVVRFGPKARQPGATALLLMALVFIAASYSGVFVAPAVLTSFAVLAVAALFWGVEQPVLTIGPEEYRLDIQRPSGRSVAMSGKTSNLKLAAIRLLEKRRLVHILLLRDGVREHPILVTRSAVKWIKARVEAFLGGLRGD